MMTYGTTPLSELIGKVRQGDCSVLTDRLIPDESVDLVVTSPPYDDLRRYNGYSFDFPAIAKQLFRVIKNGGVCVWVIGDRIKKGRSLTSMKQALAFVELGFTMHDVMIYQKKNTPFMRSNAYTNCYEFMFVLTKGSPKTFNPLKTATARSGQETAVYNKGPDGDNSKRRPITLGKEKVRNNIWSYAVGLGGTTSDRYAFEHKAMFPEGLAKDHILSWTNPDDLVLDPMCGAGTTLKMAEVTGRKWIGMDVSAEYTKIARRRAKGGTRTFGEMLK